MAETFVEGMIICVAPNVLTVESERSNYSQVLCEFYVPKNLFHMLPRVLKVYLESLDIAFYRRMSFSVRNQVSDVILGIGVRAMFCQGGGGGEQ